MVWEGYGRENLPPLPDPPEPSLLRVVLESLGLRPDAPPVARARDPTDLLGAEVD